LTPNAKNQQVGHSIILSSIYSLVPALEIWYGGMHNFTTCKSSILNELILVGLGHYDTMSKLSVFISLSMCLHTHTPGILPHTLEERWFST